MVTIEVLVRTSIDAARSSRTSMHRRHPREKMSLFPLSKENTMLKICLPPGPLLPLVSLFLLLLLGGRRDAVWLYRQKCQRESTSVRRPGPLRRRSISSEDGSTGTHKLSALLHRSSSSRSSLNFPGFLVFPFYYHLSSSRVSIDTRVYVYIP